MNKFYYEVINPVTKEVLNPCFEPSEGQGGINVSFNLLEQGVQLRRVQTKEWNKIETLKDAIYKLGKDDPFVELYNQFKDVSESYYPKDVLAYLKLRIITAAINDEWEQPTFKKCERWYPWFHLYTAEQLSEIAKDEWKPDGDRALYKVGSHGGLAYLYAGGTSSDSYTCVAVRLAFETKEKADYAAKKFIDVYADYLLP